MSHNRRGVDLRKDEASSPLPLTRADLDRFWAKVDKTPGCWLWTSNVAGGKTGQKYGQFSFQLPGADGKRKCAYAHRIVWELSHGPILPGSEICHHCDVAICCNPAHLYLGDRASNTRDAVERGRNHVARPRRHKVTSDQLAEVDALIASGVKRRDIAARFGVSEGWVSQYAKGIRRKYDRPVAEPLKRTA